MDTIQTPTTNNTNEFEIVKAYLLKCPLVASVQNSPAIKAAIEGIEKEQKRQIRDAKLRSKFVGDVHSNSNSINNSNKIVAAATPNPLRESSCLNDGEEIVVVEKDDVGVVARASSVGFDAALATTEISFSNSNSNSNSDDMEWQDVPHQQNHDDTMVPSSGNAIGDSFTMEQGDESSSAEACFLGKTLATACIDAIAEQQQNRRSRPVVVSTPLAAIAVALHASLRSDVLGFACTGVPEDTTNHGTKKRLGFAAPVRELHRTEFLPRGWDDTNNNYSNNNNNNQSFLQSPPPLRYRKMDTGAEILTVEGHPSNNDDKDQGNGCIECRVTFVLANNSKESSIHPGLRFPLSEHINLDSWNAATLQAGEKSRKSATTTTKIAPSLHYKNLSGLLSKFCRTFDLGAVHSDSVGDHEKAIDIGTGMVRPTIIGNNHHSTMVAPSVFAEHSLATTKVRSSTMESRDMRFAVPSTLDQAFPPAAAARRNNDPTPMMNYPPHRGDFAGDLLPASSGLQDPRFGRMGGRMGGSGNLMGPGHPMFSPNVGGGEYGYGNGHFPGAAGVLPIGGPGTMQPRYDPIMPLGIGGGGGDPPGSVANRRNPRGPRGRTPGEPNPDHLPPPNALGNNNNNNNMFM